MLGALLLGNRVGCEVGDVVGDKVVVVWVVWVCVVEEVVQTPHVAGHSCCAGTVHGAVNCVQWGWASATPLHVWPAVIVITAAMHSAAGVH